MDRSGNFTFCQFINLIIRMKIACIAIWRLLTIPNIIFGIVAFSDIRKLNYRRQNSNHRKASFIANTHCSSAVLRSSIFLPHKDAIPSQLTKRLRFQFVVKLDSGACSTDSRKEQIILQLASSKHSAMKTSSAQGARARDRFRDRPENCRAAMRRRRDARIPSRKVDITVTHLSGDPWGGMGVKFYNNGKIVARIPLKVLTDVKQ